jgi:hypothetical protein
MLSLQVGSPRSAVSDVRVEWDDPQGNFASFRRLP